MNFKSLIAAICCTTLLVSSCFKEGYEQNDITTLDCIIGFGQKAGVVIVRYGDSAPVITSPEDWKYEYVDSLFLLSFTAPDLSDKVTLEGKITYASTDGRNSINLRVPVFIGYKQMKLKSVDQVLSYSTADSSKVDISGLKKDELGTHLLDTSYVNRGYVIGQDKITTIPTGLFNGKEFEDIVFPQTVKTLCDNCIAGVKSSKGAAKLYFKTAVPPSFLLDEGTDPFLGCNVEIHIPAGSRPSYEAAWGEFLTKADSFAFVED